MKRVMWIIPLLMVFPVWTQAASFDCSKASAKVEHLICENPYISKLDEEMFELYGEVLKKFRTRIYLMNNKKIGSMRAIAARTFHAYSDITKDA